MNRRKQEETKRREELIAEFRYYSIPVQYSYCTEKLDDTNVKYNNLHNMISSIAHSST